MRSECLLFADPENMIDFFVVFCAKRKLSNLRIRPCGIPPRVMGVTGYSKLTRFQPEEM